MLFDSHVHPDYSPDATGSIRDYCRRAQEVGLAGLCFTTHFEPDPERDEFESVVVRGERRSVATDWAEFYLEDIARAQEEFPDLLIRSGVELGYEMGLEGMTVDFLDRHRFDFVLGAVHCVEHVAISGGHEVPRMMELLVPNGPEWLAHRYFDYLQAAVGSRLFDCIAHLDIYRKYALPVWAGGPGEHEFRAVVEERLGPALAHLAECGVGLEVNTSGYRRGQDEPYPESRVVRMAREAGVRVFTVGSDAHRLEDLGAGLDRAVAVLTEQGVRPVRFEGRQVLVGPAG